MAVQIKLYIGNSNMVELAGLRASNTPTTYINDATVTVTITDLAGTEVTGETWPKSMNYVASSNGVYRADLSASLGLTEDSSYLVVVNVTATDGTGKWTQEARATRR